MTSKMSAVFCLCFHSFFYDLMSPALSTWKQNTKSFIKSINYYSGLFGGLEQNENQRNRLEMTD